MPNLRVIYLNAADSSTLSASTTAGSLAASLMLNDRKVSAHRSTGTSAVYTLTWATDQAVGAVALPATNLTSTATIRVQLYSDTAGSTQIADSGTKVAAGASNLGLHGKTSITASDFAFGGATKAAVWFTTQPTNVRRVVITLTDASNPAGFIDCSRIVAGPYWEAVKNPGYGGAAGVSDLTKVDRTESGDLVISRGPMFQTMSLKLDELSETKRAEFFKIVRSAGSYKNLFFSLLPDNASGSAEQDHMIYGRRANSAFAMDYYGAYSTQLEIEGW